MYVTHDAPKTDFYFRDCHADGNFGGSGVDS